MIRLFPLQLRPNTRRRVCDFYQVTRVLAKSPTELRDSVPFILWGVSREVPSLTFGYVVIPYLSCHRLVNVRPVLEETWRHPKPQLAQLGLTTW